MPKNSRLTDITFGPCVCCPGLVFGIIITGSTNTFNNNLYNARIGDLVLGFCGHLGILVTGSPNVINNNRRTVRIGDLTTLCLNPHVVITGSNNTFDNESV